MSLPMRPSTLPQCTSCIRRLARSGLDEWRPSSQQVRGKKKLANTSSAVTVRLLKDVKTFGRKGAYVPISIGQMRNAWYPQRMAEYVTDTQLKDLKVKNITAERDFKFGVEDPVAADAQGADVLGGSVARMVGNMRSTKPARTVEVEHLTPERTTELLNVLVPRRLDFYKQPIIEAAPSAESKPSQQKPRQQQSQRSAVNSAAADLLAARSQAKAAAAAAAAAVPTAVSIYGSVSTADVANAMKALLAENDEAARIVFGEEDVRFVNVSVAGEPAVETDKIKHLGEFEVEVRIIKNSPVKKVVRVLAQDKQPDTTAA